MKYRYRNRKTGEEINTSNRIGGKNWEPVEEEPVLPPEDDFEEETVEDPSEEAPADKPKAARRGKK